MANASFFTDYARPATLMRFRYDFLGGMKTPDKAEYYWTRADGKGGGPNPTKSTYLFKGKRHAHRGETAVDFNQLYLYSETAIARASFFVEIPYRSDFAQVTGHQAGFSDMNLGTKSLLLDCELLQVAFQFKTYLPIGNASKGLGNGHVSLEPSLLMALRLSPDAYIQGQLAQWIPIGGDRGYQGGILHYHLSGNRVLYKFTPNVPLIGTLEFNGWSFQDGLYADPVFGPRAASHSSYFSMGPGLRMSICDTVDFGAAIAFPLNEPNWANPQIRTEFRWRF